MKNKLLYISIILTLFIVFIPVAYLINQGFHMFKTMNQETCSIRIHIEKSKIEQSDINIIYTGNTAKSICIKSFPEQEKYFNQYAPVFSVFLEDKPLKENPKLCEFDYAPKNIHIKVTSDNQEDGNNFCIGLKNSLTQ